MGDVLLVIVAMAHHHAESAVTIRDTAIRSARAAGHSWEAIGQALGMSKSNAHKRFRHLDPPPEDDGL